MFMKRIFMISVGLLLMAGACFAQGKSDGKKNGKGKSEQVEKDKPDDKGDKGQKGDKGEKGDKGQKDSKDKPDNQGQDIKALNDRYNAEKKAIQDNPNLSKEQKKAQMETLQKQHDEALKNLNGGDKSGVNNPQTKPAKPDDKAKGKKGEKGKND